MLEELFIGTPHSAAFLPKFHCELNPIEQRWGFSKAYCRRLCNYSIGGLRTAVPESLAAVPLDVIRRFCRRVERFVSMYRMEVNGVPFPFKIRNFIMHKYSSHRCIPATVFEELDASLQVKEEKLVSSMARVPRVKVEPRLLECRAVRQSFQDLRQRRSEARERAAVEAVVAKLVEDTVAAAGPAQPPAQPAQPAVLARDQPEPAVQPAVAAVNPAAATPPATEEKLCTEAPECELFVDDTRPFRHGDVIFLRNDEWREDGREGHWFEGVVELAVGNDPRGKYGGGKVRWTGDGVALSFEYRKDFLRENYGVSGECGDHGTWVLGKRAVAVSGQESKRRRTAPILRE